MEHFIRIAFWIVTLAGCLSARSLLWNVNDLDTDVLQAEVKCLPDSTFYTPTNVKVQCLTKALDCVKNELNGTVKADCEDPAGYINISLEVLDNLINKTLGNPPKNSECDMECEDWPEKPFKKFLKEMESLAQHHISASG